MLKALIAGEREPARLAGLALGRLKDKREALEQVLVGRFTEHHAFLLRSLLAHLEFLETQIGDFDGRVTAATQSMTPALDRVDTIPGVARRSAEQIIAELADDIEQFPTAAHAASWTGMCPGNHHTASARLIQITCEPSPPWIRRGGNTD
jgi:transposase